MPRGGSFQQARELVEANLSSVSQKLVVLSGKGGVGKTAMSVNISVSLADRGCKVCLLDTDIHGPNVLRLLNLQGRMPEVRDNRIVPLPFSETLSVVSSAFMLTSEDSPLIWRGPLKVAAIQQFLTNVEWGGVDYLVVDSPPGTGDEPLTVAQLLPPPAAAVLVTTPQQVATDDVRKAVGFCNRVGLPIAGMVENMSGMSCPHCGGQIDLYKRGGGRLAAAELGVPFLGEVPFDPAMVIASDKGVPFVREFPDSPAARAIAGIVAQLPHGK
jgi:ATP-binding protein involved in chromosome partitioning